MRFSIFVEIVDALYKCISRIFNVPSYSVNVMVAVKIIIKNNGGSNRSVAFSLPYVLHCRNERQQLHFTNLV